MTNTTDPLLICFSFQHGFLVLLRPAQAVTFKAKGRGDRSLKAINNQMLSESFWRKRMQLYEQGPGLRQRLCAPGVFEGWLENWNPEVWRGRHRQFIILCRFILGARSKPRKPPLSLLRSIFPFTPNTHAHTHSHSRHP